MEDSFVKVFDIADSGFRSIGFASFGFIFIIVGLVMFFWPKIALKLDIQKTKKETKYQKFSRFFFLGFSILWTSTALVSTYNEYANLRDTACKTVEGKVENFDPMPYGGHKRESYTVQGVKFSYSDYIITNGFNNTASHDGPVNQDSVVRICYVPKGNTNIITKLEVKGYKGAIKDYSGRFELFSHFRQLNKDRQSRKSDKTTEGHEKAMAVAQKYMVFLLPMFVTDFLLYIIFFIPFFRIFFKVKVIEHKPYEIDQKLLNQEKHTLENLTVKYDGEDVIWGRPYGIEIFQAPGCALKMYLNREKTQVIRSEIRMSTLMYLAFFISAGVAVLFFKAVDESLKMPDAFDFLPIMMLPVIFINFWMLKKRFEKVVKQFFKIEET